MDFRDRVIMILNDLEDFTPSKRLQLSLDRLSGPALESLNRIIDTPETPSNIREQGEKVRQHILGILRPNPDKSNPMAEYRSEFLPIVTKARLGAIREGQILLDLLI